MPRPAPRPIRSPAVLIAIIALSGTVILAAMGRARGPETTATDVHLETAADFVNTPVAATAEPATAKALAPTPEAKPVAASAAEVPAFAGAPSGAKAGDMDATEVGTPVPHAVIASTDLVAPTDTPASSTIIAGCLAFDDGTYRLKDATGTDAPRSRSWKSGFLKKRSATLDVVDAGALGLPNYVGQRVEVTGTLLEREVQARSLHRLAASCKK